MIKKIICLGLVIIGVTYSIRLTYPMISKPPANKLSVNNSFNKNVISASLTNVRATSPNGDTNLNIFAASGAAKNSLKIDGKTQNEGQGNLMHTSVGNIINVIPDSNETQEPHKSSGQQRRSL
jgi:hypothetical protein